MSSTIVSTEVIKFNGLLSDDDTEVRINGFEGGRVHVSICKSNVEYRFSLRAEEMREFVQAAARVADATVVEALGESA